MNSVVNNLILIRFIIRQMRKIKCESTECKKTLEPVNTDEKGRVCRHPKCVHVSVI